MSPSHPKVPRTPPGPLIFPREQVVEYQAALFRIHTVSGPYRMRWNEHRTYGPLNAARWDSHEPPPHEQPDHGVIYAASKPATAFAEVFQRSRLITLNSDRVLTGWRPTRSLRVLDLSSNWPIQNGASRALQHAPRSTCRAWAREIHRQGPELDGLLAESTLAGDPADVVVLWKGPADQFPTAPELSRTLDDPALAPLVAEAADTTGYSVA